MARGLPTWTFVLVLVRQGDRFLVVREARHGQRWWVPAGGVEPGESLEAAALRETLEEAGVQVQLDGVLRVERSVIDDGARLRVFFTAHPVDETPPKQAADTHSLEARWCTIAELEALELRGEEPLAAARYVTPGGAVAPLSFVTEEGAPFPGT
jgi:ADP-ribose pyrophosphatase YjhB (NUDIX family)